LWPVSGERVHRPRSDGPVAWLGESGRSCLLGECPMWGHRFGPPDPSNGASDQSLVEVVIRPAVRDCRQSTARPKRAAGPTQLHPSAGAGLAHSRHFAVGRAASHCRPPSSVGISVQRLGPRVGGGAERGVGGCWSRDGVVMCLVAGTASGVAASWFGACGS
jgi:hypothetical protein